MASAAGQMDRKSQHGLPQSGFCFVLIDWTGHCLPSLNFHTLYTIHSRIFSCLPTIGTIKMPWPLPCRRLLSYPPFDTHTHRTTHSKVETDSFSSGNAVRRSISLKEDVVVSSCVALALSFIWEFHSLVRCQSFRLFVRSNSAANQPEYHQ